MMGSNMVSFRFFGVPECDICNTTCVSCTYVSCLPADIFVTVLFWRIICVQLVVEYDCGVDGVIFRSVASVFNRCGSG